jgi:hypothetical protein
MVLIAGPTGLGFWSASTRTKRMEMLIRARKVIFIIGVLGVLGLLYVVKSESQ